MAHSYDVEEGKLVPRNDSKEGRFASRRQAEEFARNGRVQYRGKYRTHEEIAVYLAESSPWKGANVERTPEGWTFTLGTAVMHLADPFPRMYAAPESMANVVELLPTARNVLAVTEAALGEPTQIACMGCLVPGHPHGCGRRDAA